MQRLFDLPLMFLRSLRQFVLGAFLSLLWLLLYIRSSGFWLIYIYTPSLGSWLYIYIDVVKYVYSTSSVCRVWI